MLSVFSLPEAGSALEGEALRRVLVRGDQVVLLTAAHRIVRLAPSRADPASWTTTVYDTFARVADIFVDEGCRHLCFTSEQSLYYLSLAAQQSSPSLLIAAKLPISSLLFHPLENNRILLFAGTIAGSVISLLFTPPSAVEQLSVFTLEALAPIGSMTLWKEGALHWIFILVFSLPLRVHVLPLDQLPMADRPVSSSATLPGHATHDSSLVLSRVDEELISYAIVTDEGVLSGIFRADSLRDRCPPSHSSVMNHLHRT